MGKKRRQKGQSNLVWVLCPFCRRYYTVKKDEIRDDKKCFFCVHGIALSNVMDGQPIDRGNDEGSHD